MSHFLRHGARAEPWLYGLVVAVGAVFVLMASINQPYNQNELLQIGPYGGNTIGDVTSGTRQPPVDPVLGALVQHLLGEGQLRQRLVPAGAATGTLVVTALLLRRQRTGFAGIVGLAFLATMPLFVRYSAYTRPYALPLFLMVAFVLAASVFIGGGRRRWLAGTGLLAALLPATRVTEPTALLVTTVAVLAWLGWRRRLPRVRAWSVAAVALAALVLVGVPMVRNLGEEAPSLWDPRPSGLLDRAGVGLDEFVHELLPLLGRSLPLWPLLLAVVVAAFTLSGSRRLLLGWWFFWPLAAAPVGFAIAYHFITTIDFDQLPYRARAAYFFTVPLALVVTALADLGFRLLRESRETERSVPVWAPAAVAVALVTLVAGNLPAAVTAATTPDVPDYAAAARLVDDLPADALVLYDRPGTFGEGHQGFLAPSRYLRRPDVIVATLQLARSPRRLPDGRPLYLMVDATNIVDASGASVSAWERPIEGWKVVGSDDRFTVYAPTSPREGPRAAADAMLALADALGVETGYVQVFAAASLLRTLGVRDQAAAVVDQLYDDAGPALAEQIRADAKERGLG